MRPSNKPPKTQTPGADIGRPFDPEGECRTLADYRPALCPVSRPTLTSRRLHAALPVIATIDDHELADGAGQSGADAHDPVEHGPWEPPTRPGLPGAVGVAARPPVPIPATPHGSFARSALGSWPRSRSARHPQPARPVPRCNPRCSRPGPIDARRRTAGVAVLRACLAPRQAGG